MLAGELRCCIFCQISIDSHRLTSLLAMRSLHGPVAQLPSMACATPQPLRISRAYLHLALRASIIVIALVSKPVHVLTPNYPLHRHFPGWHGRPPDCINLISLNVELLLDAVWVMFLLSTVLSEIFVQTQSHHHITSPCTYLLRLFFNDYILSDSYSSYLFVQIFSHDNISIVSGLSDRQSSSGTQTLLYSSAAVVTSLPKCRSYELA